MFNKSVPNRGAASRKHNMTTTHKTNINDLVPDVVGEILGFLHPHTEENIALKKELKIYGELFKNVKIIFEHEFEKKWSDNSNSWRWRRRNTKRCIIERAPQGLQDVFPALAGVCPHTALNNMDKLLDRCLAGRKEKMISQMEIYKRRQTAALARAAADANCAREQEENMKKLANKMKILGIDYSPAPAAAGAGD